MSNCHFCALQYRKKDNVGRALTVSERRRWGETWETPAGTILLQETTEVPCLPSLGRLNKYKKHIQTENENTTRPCCHRKKQKKPTLRSWEQKVSPTWSCQEHPEQREETLHHRADPRSQRFACSHHTVTWLEEAVTWKKSFNWLIAAQVMESQTY